MTATGIAHGSIGPGAGSPPVVRAGAGDRIGARRPERSHWTGMALELKTWKLHGRSVNYVQEGSGPVLMLIHGMAGSYQNWERVIEPLAQHHTVLAPDLPGHGASAPGGGDYSIGALATELRDLLIVLGHERATFVGHSLGGGIVMQLAYQSPELVERLVLVSSGGLGPEVSPVLRAAALPGSDLFIAATAGPGSIVGSGLDWKSGVE